MRMLAFVAVTWLAWAPPAGAGRGAALGGRGPAGPGPAGGPGSGGEVVDSDKIVLDRVAAVVNEQIILRSDVVKKLALDGTVAAALERVGPKATQAQVDAIIRELEEEALDELINRRLVLDEGKRLGVDITDAMVDVYMRNIIRANNFKSEVDLRKAIDESGQFASWAEYRVSLKEDIIWFETQRSLTNFSVTDAQVREHYRKMTKGEDEKVEVFAYEVRARGGSPAERDEALQAARKIASALSVGEDPADVAAGLGQATSPVRIARGQIAPTLEDAVFSAKVGAVVGPLPSGQGYRVYKVLEHVSSDLVPFEQAKDKIRELLEGEAQLKAEQQLYEQLRAHAHIDRRGL